MGQRNSTVPTVSRIQSLQPKSNYLKVDGSATVHQLSSLIKLLVCPDHDTACFLPAMCVVFRGACWRQCKTCASNHEPGSDPARSLSGFASFSSPGYFWHSSEWHTYRNGSSRVPMVSLKKSILLSSAGRASATWCNTPLFFVPVLSNAEWGGASR